MGRLVHTRQTTRNIPSQQVTRSSEMLITYRLTLGKVKALCININHFTFHLVRPTSIVIEHGDAVRDISDRPLLSLAVVERLDLGQQIEVLFDQIGYSAQQLSSIFGGCRAPWTFERSSRGGHGQVNVLAPGFRDMGDDLFGAALGFSAG